MFLLRELSKEFVVRDQLLIVGISLIFPDHRGGEQHYLDPGCLAFIHDGSHIVSIGIEGYSRVSVPDIIDPTTDRDPVGFFAMTSLSSLPSISLEVLPETPAGMGVK